MAMNGYTKLFNSIVASTIWSEPDETRIIWITMLAMANQRGIVETSIPGLAVLARVHVDKCREAITTLESPDFDSRSQEYEGRRIQKVDGGWLILNHAKYRAKLSADERREYKTIKQREYRMKTPVDKSGLESTRWTHTDSDTDTKEEKVKSIPPAKTAGDVNEFEVFWSAYPKKLGKKDALRAWIKAGTQGRLGEVLASLEGWKKFQQWQDSQFIPYPSTWLSKGLWLETPKEEPNGARKSITERTTRAENRVIEADRQAERVFGRSSGLVGGLRPDLSRRPNGTSGGGVSGDAARLTSGTPAPSLPDSTKRVTGVSSEAGENIRTSSDSIGKE